LKDSGLVRIKLVICHIKKGAETKFTFVSAPFTV